MDQTIQTIKKILRDFQQIFMKLLTLSKRAHWSWKKKSFDENLETVGHVMCTCSMSLEIPFMANGLIIICFSWALKI